MAQKSLFVCQNCNYHSTGWVGRCPSCGQWNTMVETPAEKKKEKERKLSLPSAVEATQLKQLSLPRLKTQIEELDRVLGGGLVPGQTILFAGEPGIGKSTLLTQLTGTLKGKGKIIYLCGEESPHQVGLRLSRLKISSQQKKKLLLLPHVDVDEVIAYLNQSPPPLLLIIDSIQTLTTQDLTGVAGSVGQVRETAQRLINWAKKNQVPLLLVGHVTKKGVIAGPKVLEHAVDTVIYFEGERSADLRILRTSKNRFGPTDEIGIFQMTQTGLQQVTPEQLREKLTPHKSGVGCALTVTAEGNRMMVTEIQALVTQSFTPLPKRVISGINKNRAEMLIAICQKHLRLPLFKYDIFLNVAGGIKITEPTADLAVCAAIFSSYRNQPLPPKTAFIGELSLLGEVTPASRQEKRIKQAQNLGIKTIFQADNLPSIKEIRKIINQ